MVADIMSGKTSTADIFFLIGIILSALAAIIRLIPVRANTTNTVPPYPGIAFVLIALALGCVSWGLMAL